MCFIESLAEMIVLRVEIVTDTEGVAAEVTTEDVAVVAVRDVVVVGHVIAGAVVIGRMVRN